MNPTPVDETAPLKLDIAALEATSLTHLQEMIRDQNTPPDVRVQAHEVILNHVRGLRHNYALVRLEQAKAGITPPPRR